MFTYVGRNQNLKDLKGPKGPTRGPDVIRKEAWPFCRKKSGVRLCWELEEPEGPLEEPEGPFEEPEGPKGDTLADCRDPLYREA